MKPATCRIFAAIQVTSLVTLVSLTSLGAAAQEIKLVIPAQDSAQAEQPGAETSSNQNAAENRLVLPAGTMIPLELQNTINTRNSRAGDRIYFQTIYPIIHEGRVVIPAGSYVRGSLTRVKRPGRIKGRAELHVRFDEMTLPNGYTVDINASLAGAGTTGGEKVDRTEGGIKGEGSKAEDASVIASTASQGTLAGALATRSRTGALGGAGIGAAAGLVAVLLTRGKDLVLERGTTVEIVLGRPLPLDPKMADFDWTDYSPR